jgi:hypothetical protein
MILCGVNIIIAANMEHQLLSRQRQGTDIVGLCEPSFMCPVEYSGKVPGKFLYCHFVPGKTKQEATFQTLAYFIVNNEVSCTRSANISADGISAMTGRMKGISTSA